MEIDINITVPTVNVSGAGITGALVEALSASDYKRKRMKYDDAFEFAEMAETFATTKKEKLAVANRLGRIGVAALRQAQETKNELRRLRYYFTAQTALSEIEKIKKQTEQEKREEPGKPKRRIFEKEPVYAQA